MHKFNPAHKNKLDNDWRRQVLLPKPILEKLGLLAEDVVADVGCGIGYFSVPAAEMISPENIVYALDTSKEMLTEVEKRAESAGISNIVVVETEEYDFKLQDESVSFVLIVTVLHEIVDKEMFLREANRILKPAGRLAIIDWEKKPTKVGPPIDHRIDKQEAVEFLKSSGLKLSMELEIADVFYGLVGVKSF
ncbi:methylase involved in ubiquinone/menaquinone biosynthesis [Desulfosporosinus orientis DSM 765]|uniref:Methylase involved in ubiquinone/menaquinone biosynthesis n=1 Tax=Desulfosporosinus orientis (strain ATCC 19365 / DSM 765 / NCIMB 8382 / VKM B-1628 / Singapore I) TaxID=768706 RepID=G7W934_DESOD|nr:methyltransferase domain-containing protein [Desulfosporosinus orientis]AET68675.1 methylase involved in ubiquinone/menaquinone biosynthesis [Desulfosporosinus orientis DSM 765]